MFDELANRVSGEYELFLVSLAGQYFALSGAGVILTPRAVSDFYKAGKLFLNLAEGDATTYLAHFRDGASETLVDALNGRFEAFSDRLRWAVAQNVRTISDRMMSGHLDISKMLHDQHGAIGLLVQQQMTKINFKLPDAAGRLWDAQALVRSVARDFAYQSHLDTQLDILTRTGHDKFQVIHPDADHPNNGRVFSASEFSEIRAEVFHPNSKATVMPYVPVSS